ncbi:DUF3575 domain-containing protein [Winogradskyella sp. 3972H.M.0a.05]|uniref:DUF3575 domain-containing protein n=1 Tax=Winogradskyella sp. 3972H.M.0a.05 TaxID=2950277 RepID=UPI00339B5349
MKHIILSAFLCLFVIFGNAQDNNEDSAPKNYNEVKFNALSFIIGAVDFGYERTLNEESSIGVSAFIPFDEDIKDDIQYYISPYYRFYFGKKYAAGFFLEGFGMLNSSDRDEILFLNLEDDDFVTDFALGIGLGGKWVTNKGFTGELNFGVGRNLFNANEGSEFVAKIGITVGYRF